MALLAARALTFTVGHPALLDGIEFELDAGEQVCLVGRNGEGKTTLLRLLAGELAPDDGSLWRADGVRIATLPQTFPNTLPETAFGVVASGLGELGPVLEQQRAAQPEARERLEQAINRLEGWDAERITERWCSLAGIAPDAQTSSLSGGQLRRILLARAMVGEPEVLLLDEPTNHLDLPGIEWLEKVVSDFPGAVMFITHDRAFLRRVATRILELDRGQITSWPGDYANYLRRREARKNAEAQADARFDKLLSEEERWIRQGIKARRTRNEGRVRRLQAMREERQARRVRTGNARFSVEQGERSSRRVIEAQAIGFGYDGQRLIDDFSCIIQRGDKVGIVGPNGAGKTTLIRLLLGEIEPDTGRVQRGTRLAVAYFDQRQAQLDDSARVIDTVADGTDHVEQGGQSRHVISYLQDFLFTPDRVRGPVRALSGGERNRLMLARLFAKPSNFLVLDEPTNDLDVETLELLEERLAQYEGTVLVVSHDREFLDNVVTSVLVFEDTGQLTEYVGGYSDYARSRAPSGDNTPTAARREPRAKRRGERPKVKLSYKDRRELEALPEQIEQLEADIEARQTDMATPAFYQQDAETVASRTAQLREAERQLAEHYDRWAALDALAAEIAGGAES